MGKHTGSLYVEPDSDRRLLLPSFEKATDGLLNPKTGETAWISSESFGKYMSMVSNGKDILALDEDGNLYLIGANPEQLLIRQKRTIPKPRPGPFGHFRKPTLRPRTRSHRLLRWAVQTAFLCCLLRSIGVMVRNVLP